MFKLLGKIFGTAAGTPVAFHPTDTCPECGSKLARDAAATNVAWQCPNPDCPPQVRKRLAHWCSPEAMDITGCDAAMVAQLVGKGLAYDPAELYRLRLKEAAALDGMDDAKARALFDAITASQKRDAWRVLLGLSIPRVGAEAAQELCKHYRTLDDLFATGRERIQKEAGVSEIVARSIAHWYGDPVHRKLVARLGKAGVNFKSAIYTSQT